MFDSNEYLRMHAYTDIPEQRREFKDRKATHSPHGRIPKAELRQRHVRWPSLGDTTECPHGTGNKIRYGSSIKGH